MYFSKADGLPACVDSKLRYLFFMYHAVENTANQNAGMPQYTPMVLHPTLPSCFALIVRVTTSVISRYKIVAAERAWRASSIINRISEEYIKKNTNSRIHHFSPECIAFNQSALCHFYQSALHHELEDASSRGFQ